VRYALGAPLRPLVVTNIYKDPVLTTHITQIIPQIVEINWLQIFVESLPPFLSNPRQFHQILVAILMIYPCSGC
jgi:hypothetical protein